MKLNKYFPALILSIAWLLPGLALSAPKKPTTVAELALYKGPDRQQILEEGAKKEGKLIFYTTGTQAKYIVAAFQKKYPYIKVEEWRAGADQLVPKVIEENKANRNVSGVIGSSHTGTIVLEEVGLLQAYYSPELTNIEEDTIRKSSSGSVFAAGHFQSGRSLGYNTKLLNKDQLPKTYKDLLDPKWKGKMALAGDSGTPILMGALLATYGEDFLNKLATQEFTVQMVSARALLDMVISGEYALSPTIIDAHVDASRQKGAPVEWVPLDPVSCRLGQIMIPKRSAQPHAAMLFIDFDLSKEAAAIYKKEGYNSTRKDVTYNLRKYKCYYGNESAEEWDKLTNLFNTLFLKK